ncbi:MAG: helix-turn-helix transcriptional regulator [Emcibacteraceae bacterium]|jgi:transcriptional regulator with XRE-family HTH domain|nr:helix-turn-helix transcriptional regulator [Kordiimonadaceae bacterium]MBT7544547.1 helix-turn-helix transcriptional regulator [Kordiimonadaceae bacterium]MDB4044126.1 helix-turn-helix transcriptional regulator [Emcibacteraceae bacterium]MDC0112048.1 helix-turn-helix transcriptional regulator [Emcibacteraceae bacterium]|tara:strand:+ start:204 stop:629 length:426 start_codon:yes stop_codon:yes gene_type:complete
MTKSTPNPIDIYVGSRLRLRRALIGMSQEKLGNALEITFQQVQKYERGTNRISSSRLFQISRILDVSVSFFFDDMDTEIIKQTEGMAEINKQVLQVDKLSRRETLEFVRAYYKITDPMVRKKIFEMVKAIGNSEIGSNDKI